MTSTFARRRQTPSAEDLHQIIDLARLAPSVHNTQPWRWRWQNGRVQLYVDRLRQLPAEDPVGRNLVISCGAALHHFAVAARALGWRTSTSRLPGGLESALLAELWLRPAHRPVTADGDIAVLRERRTDRRRFTSWPVPSQLLDDLASEAMAYQALAVPVLEGTARLLFELAVQRALDLRAADAAAVAEQESWVDHGSNDGVPRTAIPVAPSAPRRRSRFGNGLLEVARPDAEGSDGLVLLGGAADDVQAWLRTGEGLDALWLKATRDGLSVLPLSQPIEVDETRQEIGQTVLGGMKRPHLLVRIGWQSISRTRLPSVPRRPVSELLEIATQTPDSTG